MSLEVVAAVMSTLFALLLIVWVLFLVHAALMYSRAGRRVRIWFVGRGVRARGRVTYLPSGLRETRSSQHLEDLAEWDRAYTTEGESDDDSRS